MNRRFLSALECGSWCLVVAAAVASTAVLSGGDFKTLDALLFFAYPISAGMLLIVLAAITPGFLPKDRIRFPVNLSVPILFAVLLLALLNLSITQDTALAKVPEAFALAQRWADRPVLGATLIVQMIVLSVVIRHDSSNV